ncbi:hypothetical protein [Roseateles cavernae]|uniref:hypothetical protein n=1 Tax=Roseateles cavernae TaxID=3153578 RepID=UPI0032E4E6DA
MNQSMTLGAILRNFKPDYPAEFLRASDQTDCPHAPSPAEVELVERRWAEVRDDISIHVRGKACVGAFSVLVGTARWNAESEEQEAVHALRRACWPVSVPTGLEYESNPLHEGWAQMQRWALGEDLLLSLRMKEHKMLDQPELWLDIRAIPA